GWHGTGAEREGAAVRRSVVSRGAAWGSSPDARLRTPTPPRGAAGFRVSTPPRADRAPGAPVGAPVSGVRSSGFGAKWPQGPVCEVPEGICPSQPGREVCQSQTGSGVPRSGRGGGASGGPAGGGMSGGGTGFASGGGLSTGSGG